MGTVKIRMDADTSTAAGLRDGKPAEGKEELDSLLLHVESRIMMSTRHQASFALTGHSQPP